MDLNNLQVLALNNVCAKRVIVSGRMGKANQSMAKAPSLSSLPLPRPSYWAGSPSKYIAWHQTTSGQERRIDADTKAMGKPLAGALMARLDAAFTRG